MRRVALLCILVAVGGGLGVTATTLRISLPPVLEALPIAFAEAWGMFDEAGLAVELVGITNNENRSQALRGGSLDGVMSDVTSAVLDYLGDQTVVVVASAGSTPQAGAFRVVLVSRADTGPATVDELLQSSRIVAVMCQMDEEYLLDQFFLVSGSRGPRISCFYDMLFLPGMFGAGVLPSAVLPEPFYTYIATLVPVSGAPPQLIVLSDFSSIPIPPRVMLFREEFVEGHVDDVAAFLRVYDAAVERMNATPREQIVDVGLDVVLDLFFQGQDRTLIQQQALDAMSIPVFERPAPLSEEIFESVTEWMADKGYLSGFPNKCPSLAEFTDFTLLP
jgi:ABC-type nitrate/sulfonate/bicarbonate transport system substrate-binding protein